MAAVWKQTVQLKRDAAMAALASQERSRQSCTNLARLWRHRVVGAAVA